MRDNIEIVERGMRIRFADERDIAQIQCFIREHWDERYSYATNPDLLEYIHKQENEVWYVVLETLDGTEILGTMGYLLCNKKEQTDVVVCLLKVRKKVKGLMGTRMLLFLKEHVPNRFVFNCGLRTNTFGIYHFLQWDVCKLNYYYRIADTKTYEICKIVQRKFAPVKESGATLTEFHSFEELRERFDASKFEHILPYKDEWYIKWRYFDFPYYKFRVWGIEEDKEIKGLLIGREISWKNSKMLAVIDYIGEEQEMGKLSSGIQRLIEQESYEYIECFNYGFTEETMYQAGFTLRTENDPNILPSHFEPFEQVNVEEYFFTTAKENLRVFRGDGNHDVPRYIGQ